MASQKEGNSNMVSGSEGLVDCLDTGTSPLTEAASNLTALEKRAILKLDLFYDRVRYASLFLSIPGAFGVMPSLAAWTADNSEPHVRKASALAWGGMVANVGGLFSVWIFTLGQPPRYPLPTEINIFLAVVIITCCVLNVMWLRHAQKNKSEKRNEILQKFSRSDSDEIVKEELQNYPTERDLTSAQAWDHLGDKHPDFKYIY
ncbi:hypothetical protein PtB15_7B448 [Puccinia triticina]|nr:hypothetical protein PtB15_7B448 [Puccinia triticina]